MGVIAKHEAMAENEKLQFATLANPIPDLRLSRVSPRR